MKADIQQLESLNELFLQVLGNIFLSSYSNETFNEMTGGQKKILFTLSVRGPQKMSDIARLIAVTMSGATGTVDKLVRAGLVARENDPSDRRIILISLTARGKQTVKQLNRIHEKRLEEVLEGLEEAKRVELISSFRRIHELLSEIQQSTEQKGGGLE